MELGSEFHVKPGASESAISNALAELGRELPADYLRFLRHSNGGEGFIAGHYLQLWAIEEMPGWSKDYLQHTEFEGSGELLLFGSNGGGEGFGFDWAANGAIVEAPFIGMDRQSFLHCADTFAEFLKQPTGFKE